MVEFWGWAISISLNFLQRPGELCPLPRPHPRRGRRHAGKQGQAVGTSAPPWFSATRQGGKLPLQREQPLRVTAAAGSLSNCAPWSTSSVPRPRPRSWPTSPFLTKAPILEVLTSTRQAPRWRPGRQASSQTAVAVSHSSVIASHFYSCHNCIVEKQSIRGPSQKGILQFAYFLGTFFLLLY